MPASSKAECPSRYLHGTADCFHIQYALNDDIIKAVGGLPSPATGITDKI